MAFLVLFLFSAGIPKNLFASVKYSVLGDSLVGWVFSMVQNWFCYLYPETNPVLY